MKAALYSQKSDKDTNNIRNREANLRFFRKFALRMENKDKDTAFFSKEMPSPWVSIIPIVVLIAMVSLSITLFGSDSLGGGNQVALLVATGMCVCLSMMVYKTPWKVFETHIAETIGSASVSIVILIIIGMLSGAWMISGVVPTLIYYGVQIMSPQFFLVSTCAICAIVSLMTGSSWTTIATIGVALLGIGDALSVPAAWTAGAIISGAYFGDKISPLSDTTILAASTSGTELFTHIRYMLYTTIPSILISLIIFFAAGFWYGNGEVHITEYTQGLENTFNINLWTLIVPLFTAILIAKKVPSLITLFASSLAAGVCALILQPDILLEVAKETDGTTLNYIKGMMITFFTSTNVDTGNDTLNDLVSTGGMAGMLDTIWLILCAMCFGGSMVASKMLQSLTAVVISFIRNTFGLVASTVCTGLGMNLVTSDQYISIIISASMYKDVYKKNGYAPELLSRSTEDSATVTSVLIPWNTCGMTQATVLGVPTLTYLPYCFFNIISPIMSCLVAAIGYKIRRIKTTK
ncbi:MAG: sodium:proton antiporter [Prevotellaceae bacterium]|nr:sodium:proton antiporter [Candidatus Minthosoma caballi]